MEICRRSLRTNLVRRVMSAVGARTSSRKPIRHLSTTAVPKDEVARECPEPLPYKDIPSPKTFLNLNWDVIKNPTSLVENMEERVRSLGNIYVEKGIPGLPAMVVLTDPKDIETVYRAGDKGYPARFPMKIWVDSRDELKLPYGVFLQ